MNKKKLKGLTALSAVLTLSLAGGILAGCGGKEDHTLSAVNEVAATCTTDGHRSYYKCTDDGCGKYFADAEGKEELSEEDVVLHALGHNPVHHEEKDVTCTEDGNAEYWGCSRCDAKFADENQTPFNGDPVLAHPGHHFTDVTPATDPEPDKEGNVEHWHCDRCEKNYNNSYGDKEIEDVTIPAIAKLDSVTLKLQGYREGETGNLSGGVTLTGKYDQTASGSLTDGVGTVANVYAMEYDVECNGYVGKLAFEAGKSVYELTLEYNYATSTGESATTTDPELPDNKKSTVDLSKMNDKNHTIVLSDGTYATKDYTEAKLTLPSEVQGSKNVSISFTLKFLDNSMYEGNVGDSGFNPLSRVGVKMADEKGVFFMMMDKNWHNDGEGNPSDALYVCPIQPKDYIPDGKTEVEGTFCGWDNANEGRFAAVAEALKGDGLQIRMVRAKTYIRMFLKLDDAWVEVMNVTGVVECAENADTDIRLLINGHKWEFSNIEYGSMTEEAYKATSLTEAGHQAHLTIDDMYFNLNGTLSSLEEITIPQLSPITSVALTLKDESGNFIAENTKVWLTNAVSEIDDIEATVGANGIVTLAGTTGVYAGFPYVVKVEGYAGTHTITFEESTATIETLIPTVWEYGDAAKTSIANGNGGWANHPDGSFTNSSTDDKIAFSATYPTSKEIAVDTGDALDVSDSYTVYFTMKATSVTGWQQRIGIRLAEGTGESTVGFFLYHRDLGKIFVGALSGKIDFDAQGNSAVVESALTIDMFANGLEMKAVREQNTATLYAKIDGEWTKITEQTLAGGKGAIGFSASAGDYEITDVALTAKLPEALDTVTLTLKDYKGGAIAEGTKVTLTSAKGEIEATVGKNGAVVLTGDNAVYDNLNYTVAVAGAIKNYTIRFTGATAVIENIELPLPFDTVTLTLKDQNGNPLAQGKEVTLKSAYGTITVTVDANGAITLSGDNKVYSYTEYTVTVAESPSEKKITFTEATAEIEGIIISVKFDSVALTLKDTDGTPVAEGARVTLVSGSFSVSGTVGKNGVVTLTGENAVYSIITYTLTVDGYIFNYEIVFDGETVPFEGLTNSYTSSDQVELDMSFEADGGNAGSTTDGTDNTQIVLNGKWLTIDQALLKTTDTLKNAEVYTMTFNYKLSEIDEWGCARYGFRLTEGTKDEDAVGFFLFTKEIDGNKHVWLGNLTHDLEWRRAWEWNNSNLPAHFKEVSNVLTADMLLTGVDLKIEYRFGEATIYVKNDGGWTMLHSVKVTGTPQIAFALADHTFTVKELTVNVIKSEKLNSVALTLKDSNGAFIPSNTKVTLTSAKGTVAGIVGENGVVTLTGENAVWSYADYTVEVEGSTTKNLTVWFNGAAAELGGFVMPSPIDSVELTLKAGETPVAAGKTVTLVSERGTIEVTTAEGGVVTLTGDNQVYTLTDYTLTVEGYALTYTIRFDGATAAITTLEAVNWEYSSAESTSVVAGSGDWAGQGSFTNSSTDDKIEFTAGFPVSKELKVNAGDTLADAAAYTLYFHWKVSELASGWEGNRFGIRVTDATGNDTCGFYVMPKGNGTDVYVGDLFGAVDFNTRGNNLLPGDVKVSALTHKMLLDGADFKIEYNFGAAMLYVRDGEGWAKLYETAVAGKPQIAFSACNATHTFTKVSANELANEKKTLTLTLKNDDGVLAEGTDVKLTNCRGETSTVKVGANGAVTLETSYLGTFRAEVDGIAFNVNFSADSLTASKTISAVWTYNKDDVVEWKAADSVDNLTVTKEDDSVSIVSAWDDSSWKRGGVNVNTGTALGDSTNYTVRFKLTATLQSNWSDRFAIRLVSGNSSSNVGFIIWDKGNDGICFTKLNDNCDVGDIQPSDKTILTAEMLAAGVDIQIIRNGNSATMYAKIDGEWKSVYTVDLASDSTAQLGFYAAGGTYVYSDMSIVTVSDTVSE